MNYFLIHLSKNLVQLGVYEFVHATDVAHFAEYLLVAVNYSVLIQIMFHHLFYSLLHQYSLVLINDVSEVSLWMVNDLLWKVKV